MEEEIDKVLYMQQAEQFIAAQEMRIKICQNNINYIKAEIELLQEKLAHYQKMEQLEAVRLKWAVAGYNAARNENGEANH